MRKQSLTLLDDKALANLQGQNGKNDFSYAHWIRILRIYLRMTQADLARRARIPQSHLAGIEAGKMDPRISTVQRIYAALSCQMPLEPLPQQELKEILRRRAREIALQRLQQSAGTMALEGQAAEAEVFSQLLEKKTDAILNDPRERLWKNGE